MKKENKGKIKTTNIDKCYRWIHRTNCFLSNIQNIKNINKIMLQELVTVKVETK